MGLMQFPPNEAQPGLREPLRFTRKTFGALIALAAVIALLAVARNDLASAEWNAIFGHGDWVVRMDWLLFGIFLFFLICTSLDPNLRLDLATVAAGFAGGTVIEIWGTQTGLWYYYTGEKPPLWILPAWSASALANEKLQRAMMRLLPESWREKIISDAGGGKEVRVLHAFIAAPLLLFFLYWSSPTITQPISIAVTLLIFTAICRHRFPYYAFSLFFAGAVLGIFLEIWGTTRHCWNYYDGKTPSPFPILGHGMAGVAFWRLKGFMRSLFSFLKA